MKFSELIENILDELMPPPKTYLPLKYVQERHIVRAFLVSGSITGAANLLELSVRTVRTHMGDMFPPDRILTLPHNRGRTDVGFLIEYAARLMTPETKLPLIAASSNVWRNNRIRAMGITSKDPNVLMEMGLVEDDGPDYFYPCHRDFTFWDWYNNRDHINQRKPSMVNTRVPEPDHEWHIDAEPIAQKIDEQVDL